MSYEVFSRKYRPKDFNEIIGQESIVRTLKNAIELNRISHAYIFAGSRGLGKTTISRILTKCLNCETGITTNPCGKCENCVEIEKGSFPDMYEIDAASNRGIDDIRNIKENVNYSPIKGRYKVYIVDEAHMLTREAFNALLKTLEEPPPHNIFILATTELHKIPDTIKSRGQIFIFRPPKKEEIKKYLKNICEKEGIKFEEPALEILAEASEGGMRDAASLLDQANVFSKGNITVISVEEMLGLIQEKINKQFLKNLKKKNIKELILAVEQLDKAGFDLNIFWKQMTDRLHQNLINLTIYGNSEFFEESDIQDLIYIQNIFNKAFVESRTFPNPKHIYQLYILKLKYLKNIVSIKDILEGKIKLENISNQPQGSNLTLVETKTEKNERLTLDRILLKVKREIGGIVYSILVKAKITENDDYFVVKLNKTLAQTVHEHLDKINKIFPKPLKVEIKEDKTVKKSTKKRDESVDKILDLFNGKIISYKEKKQ